MAGKKKILYVIDQMEVGGAQKQLMELAKGLDKERFEVGILCTVREGSWATLCRDAGIRVSLVSGGRLGKLGTVRQIWRIAHEERIDILHSWLWYSNILCYLVSFFSPVLIWLAAVRGISLGLKSAHRWIEKRAYRAAVHISAVSRYNERILLDEFGVAPGKISVIYNGVESTRVGGCAPGLEMPGVTGPLLGCIANFDFEKGHGFLLEAMVRVRERHSGVRLLLVGDGPLRSEVEGYIERLGLAENVSLLGRRADIAELLALMDLMVLPSRLEGMPNVVLEAMVEGVPILATAVGGVPELIDDGKSGLLVAPADAQALAEGIEWMLDHPERAKAMAAIGRERALGEFGMMEMVQKYEQLYGAVSEVKSR